MTRNDVDVTGRLEKLAAAFACEKQLFNLVQLAEITPEYDVFKSRLREMLAKANVVKDESDD